MRKLLLMGGLCLFIISGAFGEIVHELQTDEYGSEYYIHYEEFDRTSYYGQNEINLERPYIPCDKCLSGLIASMVYKEGGEDDDGLDSFYLYRVEGCAEILRKYKYVSYLRYEDDGLDEEMGWQLWEFFMTGDNEVFVKVWLDR